MSPKLSLSSTLALSNSKFKIPQIGFGVYQSPPPTCVNSCVKAFRAGYRHIDTAIYYANENSVGRALKESKIPRSEIFITSKILSPGNDVESTYKLIEESVKKLDGDNGYVDLFLIHSPNGGKESRRLMWLALEKAKETGKVRDIGVSNYGIGHIEEIKEIGKVWPPVVNQIELHPWCQQREIVDYCEKKKIAIEAYCPLVRNQKAHDKTLTEIATKHKKSPNQILIRYCLQKGWVPLPKSDTPQRIVSNADVYDFELDEEDMKSLDGFDQGSKGAIVQAVKNS
ncbi:Aldo/keto reductase [Lentithecium fluviatile CBS 122367]|uniref:Aldo/keto reductase n=1 Tax=Lentithecium fluviatile CBS 122367 TaxID=1168545 RepID=A0A6G1J2Q2_9PLEO|nr:Aldo/keto reductase [Lentithecium fluviatile CBS 122367]